MVFLGHAQPPTTGHRRGSHHQAPPAFAGAGYCNGILRWFDSGITNGLMEAINSLVQAAKAKPRGYRSVRNLIAMVYRIAGNLDLALPA